MTTNYQYFLYDINHDGVEEMIVGNKGVGGSEGNVYTIAGSGGKPSVVNLGIIGTGFRDSYRVNNGSFYHSHQYAGGLYLDYLVTVSGQGINEQQLGGYTRGKPGVTGPLLSGYNVYTHTSTQYRTAIDYSGLRSAGKVTLQV